jgi:DUF4097 and DUF4098 domain-containing protein YvlB
MEYLRTFSKTFEVREGTQLSIENRSGTITVRGEDTERVQVDVVARIWAESEDEADDQAEMVMHSVRQEDNRISIRAPALLRPAPLILFGRGPRIDYQVTVPRSTVADVSSHSGRVEIENIAGPIDVTARSGRVGLRDIAGDVRIVSRSGSVQAEAIGGTLGIESRSGGVRVSRCARDVTINARSGALHLEDVGGKLKVESRSGAVRYEGAVHDSFDIEVRSGAIRLAVDPNSVFFLDAESAHGAVFSDLSMRKRGGTQPAKSGPTVRVRARSGAIQITSR